MMLEGFKHVATYVVAGCDIKAGESVSFGRDYVATPDQHGDYLCGVSVLKGENFNAMVSERQAMESKGE